MSERSSELLLEDMLESCERILEYTKGLSFDDFSKNYLVVDAVVRNFTIIGEAIILVLITRSSGSLLKITFLN